MRNTRSGRTAVEPLGNPDLRRGPFEQQTSEIDPPFKGGGRSADRIGDYQPQCRVNADADWRAQLARNQRQDTQAIGIPKALDGTPWLRGSARRGR